MAGAMAATGRQDAMNWFNPLARLAMAALLLLAASSLVACRTMAGLGDDVSHLGQKISAKAREKTGD
jgi:predicted small secreted protein